MITVMTDKIKTLDQISYYKFLETIIFYQLTCSCGMSGCLIGHGYYERSIKTPKGIFRLSIQRVKCKHCGKTHALFPYIIVPYSQISLEDYLSIIAAYTNETSFVPIMDANNFIDESNIRHVIRQFLRHWKERIAAFGFSMTDGARALSEQSLGTFKRQFMQIKSGSNIRFG